MPSESQMSAGENTGFKSLLKNRFFSTSCPSTLCEFTLGMCARQPAPLPHLSCDFLNLALSGYTHARTNCYLNRVLHFTAMSVVFTHCRTE